MPYVLVADKSSLVLNLRNKPLPHTPHERAATTCSPVEPSGPKERSPLSILQRRQAAQPKTGNLPLRDLHLNHPVHNRGEAPGQNTRGDANDPVETVSIGFSPDPGAVPFRSTPRAPKLPKQTIARMRESIRRPDMGKHRKALMILYSTYH